MTTRTLVLPLVLLAACGGNPLPEWKTDPTPSPNAKRVDHLEKVNNSLAWQRSPYFRIEDKLDMPVYLIVADDHTACVASAGRCARITEYSAKHDAATFTMLSSASEKIALEPVA